MHGTRLNELDLHPGTAYILSKGDIIVLGAEVRRGVESFQACKFRVEFNFSTLGLVTPLMPLICTQLSDRVPQVF